MDKQATPSKVKPFMKGFFKGFLFVLECVGYLLYCLLFLWLIFGFFDNFKKK